MDSIDKTQLSDSKDGSSSGPVQQIIKTHKAVLGKKLTLRRALPHRERRMIGAWCFLDHFGPLDSNAIDGLQVAPHPHIGLQTFTWILKGEILHRASLGSKQVIQSGKVNLMTAGNGISHSEESTSNGVLHGLQLWIALPDSKRHIEPDFKHYPEVPVLTHQHVSIQVMAGEFLNVTAPTAVYSPLTGLELKSLKNAVTTLPLNPRFEYGILPLTAEIKVEKEVINTDSLLYLGCGHSELSLQIPEGERVLIIGGEPFNEEILIWWNFVARTKEEIRAATEAWNNHSHFGEVVGYPGERYCAPPMP